MHTIILNMYKMVLLQMVPLRFQVVSSRIYLSRVITAPYLHTESKYNKLLFFIFQNRREIRNIAFTILQNFCGD